MMPQVILQSFLFPPCIDKAPLYYLYTYLVLDFRKNRSSDIHLEPTFTANRTYIH